MIFEENGIIYFENVFFTIYLEKQITLITFVNREFTPVFFTRKLPYMEKIADFIDNKIDKTLFAAKFTPQMMEFEETSEQIFRHGLSVIHLFQWLGLEENTERRIALQHLGYLLLHELKRMQHVYHLRTLQLCDEHCDEFEKWLSLIDECEKKFYNFSNEAQKVMHRVRPDYPKRRLLVGLRMIYRWLEQVVAVANPIEVSSDKCNEMNLHYDPTDLSEEPPGMRKFFYLILHFLALLATPSHKNKSEKELVPLFRSSFKMFCDSSTGQNWQERHADKLGEELAGQNDEQQLETLRSLKMKLTKEIRDYLEKFGVDYCGVDKDRSAGRLCRQLYERLNGIYVDDEKEPEAGWNAKPVRMRNKDLRFYFVKEMQMGYLIQKIKELNEAVDMRKKPVENRKSESVREKTISGKEKKKSWDGIFIVDENKLANCFSSLYDRYFGEKPKSRLEGKCDQSLFFAYLYLLVEKEQLGKENFAENTRKPFFEFLREKVVKEMEKTLRTFHNRVEELQSLRKNVLSKDENLQENQPWKSSNHYKNFHGICGNFHKTGYFHELERLKKK